MNKVFEKINKAIDLIKKSDLKKGGYNDYSKYYYYTPEQIDKLVYDSCKEFNLFIKFDLIRNEYGIDGFVTVYDLDSDENVKYTMASAIPEIKATNVSQQLGGAMTYSKRYLLQNIFNIVDNNLDFDTNKQVATPKKEIQITIWLSKEQFEKTLDSDLKGIKSVLAAYDGTKGKGMKSEYRKELTKIVNDGK